MKLGVQKVHRFIYWVSIFSVHPFMLNCWLLMDSGKGLAIDSSCVVTAIHTRLYTHDHTGSPGSSHWVTKPKKKKKKKFKFKKKFFLCKKDY